MECEIGVVAPREAMRQPADDDPLPDCEMRYAAMIRDATLPLVLRFTEKLALPG